MAFMGKFVYIGHHFILPRHNAFGLVVDRKGWWFEQSVSCGFDYQQGMLKMFLGSGYFHSKDGVV